ncbi:hypothetical protein KP509_14G098100 [Ceratopteris richardii]|nr:hypothetical protein KP509_14G098100 [Ceratopteris richardii]
MDFYIKMQESCVKTDAHTYVAGLKACAKQRALILGMLVHSQILEAVCDTGLHLGNALIDMYSKCGSLQDACKVFHKQVQRDVVTWNVMLSGFALELQAHETFEMFIYMCQECKADSISYVHVLKLCSNMQALKEGHMILSIILENTLEQQEYINSACIAMYSKCGCLDDAYCIFERIQTRDIVTWNSLIAGFCQYDVIEHGHRTLQIFEKMRYQSCLLPDSTTNACVLKACSSINSLIQAKIMAVYVVERGFTSNKLVMNALINTYTRCGHPHDAYETFVSMPERDVITWNTMISGLAQHGLLDRASQLLQECQQEVGMLDIGSWNSLIAGYAQHGYGWKALAISNQMQLEGFLSDKYTFISTFSACANVGALFLCRIFHTCMLECNLSSDSYVTNSLIDMYGKCGSLEMAHKVFQNSSKQHVVTWNALIAGYAHNGYHEMAYELMQQMKRQGYKPDVITWNAMIAGHILHENFKEALLLYGEMLSGGMEPDDATFVSMIKTCSLTGALNTGQLVCAQVTTDSYDLNTAVCNACIEMFALCGSLRDCLLFFNQLKRRDRISWNTIIAALALHNDPGLSFSYFENMQKGGVKPDTATFTILLSACGHNGLLNGTTFSFESMKGISNVSPTKENVNCAVDVYGRAGYLVEAENILKSLLPYADVVGWTALLSNCKTYGNMEIGNRCFHHMLGADNNLHMVFNVHDRYVCML